MKLENTMTKVCGISDRRVKRLCTILQSEKPDVLTDRFYVPAKGKYRFPKYWKTIDACDTQSLQDAADYAEQTSKETTSEKCAAAFYVIAKKIRKAINIEGGASQ